MLACRAVARMLLLAACLLQAAFLPRLEKRYAPAAAAAAAAVPACPCVAVRSASARQHLRVLQLSRNLWLLFVFANVFGVTSG